jgi:DNA-binding transcriptional regulator PaaX
MNYNELKVRVLGLFEATEELDSFKIRQLLASKETLKLNDKAVEMALLRYWRQGLLSRTRRAGRFQYTLTERGLARKEWLLKNQ